MFLRSTVVVWDILVYVPALVMFVKIWHGNRSGRTQVSLASSSVGNRADFIVGARSVDAALPARPPFD